MRENQYNRMESKVSVGMKVGYFADALDVLETSWWKLHQFCQELYQTGRLQLGGSICRICSSMLSEVSRWSWHASNTCRKTHVEVNLSPSHQHTQDPPI